MVVCLKLKHDQASVNAELCNLAYMTEVMTKIAVIQMRQTVNIAKLMYLVSLKSERTFRFMKPEMVQRPMRITLKICTMKTSWMLKLQI